MNRQPTTEELIEGLRELDPHSTFYKTLANRLEQQEIRNEQQEIRNEQQEKLIEEVNGLLENGIENSMFKHVLKMFAEEALQKIEQYQKGDNDK